METNVVEHDGFDLGILFVHGIGQQRPGDTLIAAGGPLVKWLQAQTGGCQDIRVTQARSMAKDMPGYAVVEGTIRLRQIRWLLAESRWADEFHVPEAGEFAGWLIGDGVWISVLHCAEALRKVLLPLAAKVRADPGLVMFLASIFVGPILFVGFVIPFQLVVMLIYVVSLLPLPKVGEYAKSAFRYLAELIGDSYAYARNEVVRGSVETKVRSDLNWLSGQCPKVAMLAHSQGAAVALGALAKAKLEHPLVPCSLVTYGAGIRKLFRLQVPKHPVLRFFIRTTWIWTLGVPWALGMLWRQWSALATGSLQPWPEAGMANVYLFVPLFLYCLMLFGMASLKDDIQPVLQSCHDALPAQVFWTDLTGLADPVPAGLLLRDVAPTKETDWLSWPDFPRLVAAYVANWGNVLVNHTRYWESFDDFLPRVYQVLETKLGVPPLVWNLSDPRHGNWHRRARYYYRLTGHLALLALTALLYYRDGDKCRAWIESLLKTPVTSWLAPIQPWFGGAQGLTFWLIGAGANGLALYFFQRFISVPLWNNGDRAFATRKPWEGGCYFMLFAVSCLALGRLLWGHTYASFYDDYWRFLYWLHGVLFR